MQMKFGRVRLENEDIGVKETITLIVEKGLMLLPREGMWKYTLSIHTKHISVVESKQIGK